MFEDEMSKIQRYFLEISYYGKNYHGWQIQPNAPTIQEVMDRTLSTFLNEEIITVGAGRTDTGVHAEQFVLHFDSVKQTLHQNKDILFRLNQFLPFDIAVKKILLVNNDFHARFDAISRTYEYRISYTKTPFYSELSHFYYGELMLETMNKACEILMKYSDFTSFSKLHTDVKTYICDIKSAIWVEKNEMYVFSITADRFLRNMVRAIVGSMIDVGRNKLSLAEFEEIIKAKDRSKAGISAPAKGLFLTNIEYGEDNQ